MSAGIQDKLAELRKNLLDLSRRNRLLNLPGKGRTTLPIVDELPLEIWQSLVVAAKTMSFLAREEAPGTPPPPAREAAAEAAEMPLAPLAEPAERHTDKHLQTALDGEALQARLLHLAREAQSALLEQGANVLFLALWTVEWREPGERETAARAPLLFVPVELVRKSVHSRHAVRAGSDEILVNPCLKELMSRVIRAELPELEYGEDLDLTSWLAAARTAITAVPGWKVHEEACLGLFSFNKLLLYHDLDPQRWPASASLTDHPLVRALTGVAPITLPPDQAVQDPATLDDQPLEDSWLVVDADSSQQAAVEAGKRGLSLVIEGPPGTGKSQTITNLIAEFLAAGKKVLFVAEKAAALEVVQRRLEAAGFGEFLLELHSKSQSKRSVLDQIARALDAPSGGKQIPPDVRELGNARMRLNGYVRALHAPFGAAKTSAHAAIAHAIAQRSAPEAKAPIPELDLITRDELRQHLETLQTLDQRLERIGDPARHPWRGATLASLGVAAQQQIRDAHTTLANALDVLAAEAEGLARAFGIEAPRTPGEFATALAGHRDSPPRETKVGSPALQAWLEFVRQRAAWGESARKVFRPEAEQQLDAAALLERRKAHGGSLFRWLFPSWRKDTRQLRQFFVAGPPPGTDETIYALAALARRQATTLELLALTETVLTPHGEAIRAWLAAIGANEQDWFGGPARDTAIEAMRVRQQGLRDAFESLQDWVDHHAALGAAQTPRLLPFLTFALSPEGAPLRGRLAAAFERHFWRLFADRALEAEPILGRFVGADHETLVERFRRLDRAFLTNNRQRLLQALRKRRPDLGHDAHRESKLGILKGELRKKRRHMPLRRLFAVAGDVVQALQPCFLMSPLSVAQFLAPGTLGFDVTIFDEASQVEPADALGAIARARQVILIGDEKQLPPTSFFQKLEGANEAAPAAEDQVDPRDLESILSLGLVQLPRACHCALRWHYRSRHASLIEFSNEHFYEQKLRIFPSPHTGRNELGLAFHLVADGVYLRGGGQHNPVEARAVAQAVLAHAKRCPERSLGVGAFSAPQQRAIQDELELLLRANEDPVLEQFFAEEREEPFFVKNLETIQGDERDVIFLSVGYGPDPFGKITMNFGPLNQDGGWRRLNVLVTRARERCVLFTSLRASDLDLAATQARGVHALKDYLHLAEFGRLPASSAPRGEPDSPLEQEIAQALRERGHQVHAQVGSAGFAIDLAIVDPAAPGRYLLGIECDGATYHSSPTARDRDRLRDEVLRRLGWRIARIWSTDWYRRKNAVLVRLDKEIAAARTPAVPTTSAQPESGAAAAAAPAAPAAVAGPAGPGKLPPPEALLQTLAAELGLPKQALLTSAAKRLGYQRLGPRIAADLEKELQSLVQLGKVTVDGQGFYVLHKGA